MSTPGGAAGAAGAPGSPSLGELTPDQALHHLRLLFTRRPDGLLQGDHSALVPGPGGEPDESRHYTPGVDDVRRMDWNATARTTVPHVRTTLADRELTTWIVLDASASMDFGTGRMEKRDLAVGAAAAVAFLTERAGNRLGALLVRPDGLQRLPARGGRRHLMRVLRTALERPRVPAGPQAHTLAEGVSALRRTERRRGLVAVVSDFLEPGWEAPLRALARRQQVLAVEVVDPRELVLPAVGLLTVVDPESGRRREVPTHSRRVRERYAAAAAGQREEIGRALRTAGAARLRLRTDRDWVRDIARYAAAQRAAARRPGTGGAA
ncbi:DUF58 domain-containing protein [Streptomyces sp. MAR4 CNX-425]|uniref:DUF58 domain-containing protein n=1 Tax=Streptomyces sp. MAR4 CNX-425 TaxID=3406343 RepID=UPI003B50AE63